MLTVCVEFVLNINFNKCKFLKRKVKNLGYINEDGKIRPSPSKTLAVQNFYQPKSLKQVQSFLGLTEYFRKFLPLYAQISKPLSDMLWNESSFKFGREQEYAFVKLKDIVSNKDSLWKYIQMQVFMIFESYCWRREKMVNFILYST